MSSQIFEKIDKAESILVALSKNPSVDELCAAISLSLFFGKMGKNVTAIYSGKTPNALEFLKPEEKFSQEVNGLQDFIIAIDKEKADHLRYKLDGDLVKVFITPYRSKITEDDLEFSYGEFNVDLVIAVNVKNENDLDGALSEYGKILHDATMISLSLDASVEGLGGEKWPTNGESSVCEMVAKMAVDEGKEFVDTDVATAMLTGIVAETERFSNEKTTPEAMNLAAKLMKLGANQQLISAKMMEKMVPEVKAEESAQENSEFDVKKAQEMPVVTGETSAEAQGNVQNTEAVNNAGIANDAEAINVQNAASVIDTQSLPPVQEPVNSAAVSGAPAEGAVPPDGAAPAEGANMQTEMSVVPNNPVVDEIMAGLKKETAPAEATPVATNPVESVPVSVESASVSVEPAPTAEIKTRGFAGVNYGGVIDQALAAGAAEDSGDAGGYIGGNPELKTEEKSDTGGYIGGNPAINATPEIKEQENNMPGLMFEGQTNILKDSVLPMPPDDGSAPQFANPQLIVEAKPEKNVVVEPTLITPVPGVTPAPENRPVVTPGLTPGEYQIPNMQQ